MIDWLIRTLGALGILVVLLAIFLFLSPSLNAIGLILSGAMQ